MPPVTLTVTVAELVTWWLSSIVYVNVSVVVDPRGSAWSVDEVVGSYDHVPSLLTLTAAPFALVVSVEAERAVSPVSGSVSFVKTDAELVSGVSDVVDPNGWPAVPSLTATGGSLTPLTVIETVADDVPPRPSSIVYANESVS